MRGALLTQDFLGQGILLTDAWLALDDGRFEAFHDALRRVYVRVEGGTRLNEAQTEAELIIPTLEALGWSCLPQEQANARGRADVPDTLLFAQRQSHDLALTETQPGRRFLHGKAIVESKRWLRPLDRSGQDRSEIETPSSQMLRYLTRAEAISERAVMWGLLTNGRHWRLYWQGARSRSEEFVEFDLASLIGVRGLDADLLAAPTGDAEHALKAFYLLFSAQAFLPQTGDAQHRSFHQLALEESRHWESRVSNALGRRVFDEVFPALVVATVVADPEARVEDRAYREQVKRAALTLLYRLLFVLYAEDRDLLPARDRRYDDYSLRRIRQDVADRSDRQDVFAAGMHRYWRHLSDLFHAIAQGEPTIGLPAYNGGLFDDARQDRFARIALGDAVVAPLLDALSREDGEDERRHWINYRDLSVQQLGSIYERLLEQAVVSDGAGGVRVEPASFARRVTGSYYTHDDLVKLLIVESLGPLVTERHARFDVRFHELLAMGGGVDARRQALEVDDPAVALLSLKICDPAMGSGHFLVSLVDYLADQALEASAAAAAITARDAPDWHYESPLLGRIRGIRTRILANARAGGWTVAENQLDDRHIVRRMILKRVIHGVDKNPMAVELAKLSLWLHTFTVGAPLSFLDHHLRRGDALFGERLGEVVADLRARGGLLAQNDLTNIGMAVHSLNDIGELTDVDIAEVHQSQRLLEDAQRGLQPLRRLLDFWHALRWLAPLDAPKKLRGPRHAAVADLLSGRFGGNLLMLVNDRAHATDIADHDKAEAINALLEECRALSREEGFMHWELAFPTAWRGLETGDPQGGFDLVIGNPPWDRMKLQEVEWFAERRPEVAHQARAADRKRMIARLEQDGDPLWQDYRDAAERAETMAKVARASGQYPLLASGDINLYSLFVERASRIVRRQGVVGLLTPSGIAGDLGAAKFFRGISTASRLGALLDFENRSDFFPDVDSRFKFCALVFGGPERRFENARCAFYLHRIDQLKDADRIIPLDAADFAAVNPNTGTAPIFRRRRDAEITTRIYRAHPVLVNRSAEFDEPPGPAQALWPVRYCTMFHMTNDSGLFRTPAWLEENGGYRAAVNRWKCAGEDYVQLYEGKMVQAYDHRAASVTVNPENLHRPAQPLPATDEHHHDPNWLPDPQYWVSLADVREYLNGDWVLGFKDIASPTNMRTMIACAMPLAAFGNKVPLWLPIADWGRYCEFAPLMLANMNSAAFDFVCRQKVQGQTLNLFIVEQLPLIDPPRFEEKLGGGTVADLIRREVLHLTYTAHDMTAFARDLGHDGPPFAWDAEDRRHRLARLDALFFRLYGLDRDDAGYILDTFPIVREQDEAAFGRYRTKDLVLAYMNALGAGDIDTVVHA
jgi:hypothetical protein